MRLASASSHRCHVGIQASTAARHRGFDRSSLRDPSTALALFFSRSSSRNFIRCFVTISTLRRTECHEYGWPWSCVNSVVTVIHHLQRLLRCPNSCACRLQMSNSDTSSFVVRRLPCLRSPPPPSPSFPISVPVPVPFPTPVPVPVPGSVVVPVPVVPEPEPVGSSCRPSTTISLLSLSDPSSISSAPGTVVAVRGCGWALGVSTTETG